jgi:excinuclease ABC subunit B
MPDFKLKSEFSPKGDQIKAIREIVEGFKKGKNKQVLLGATGSGKTFTMANVISQLKKPTIIISHNKTLAAQLYSEFKGFFPENNVEYFVSYYDYYQPESYIPATDTYIEKDAQKNEKIEKLRLAATTSLLTRPDTIVIASVSCIYGIGNPENYRELAFQIKKSDSLSRTRFIDSLLNLQYERNDIEIKQGRFRVRGDTVDLILGYADEIIRIEFFGDEIEKIKVLDAKTNDFVKEIENIEIFPAKHFVIPESEKNRAIESIQKELKEQLPNLEPLLAHRLKQRVNYDIEMMQELGYCNGIENYSRHFDGRNSGEPPYCLLNFFPDDFLMIIDESHVTIPQLHGMYKGDFSRKKSLIDNGFRLPSAFDNRPLKFEEFKKFMNNIMFVSATPSDYEKKESNQIVEQIIRPTGLVDPEISVRKSENQINDLLIEIKKTAEKGNKVFVTTLTKRSAEDLSEFLLNKGIKAKYLHSEIETVERTEIIRDLRLGKFDVLVGINLLREGLDVPEVALVAILDADKEGFLRNEKSLIQTIGRAARNVDGHVIMYADKMTDSIKNAINETDRRRKLQVEYNKKHGIIPVSIKKKIQDKLVEIEGTKKKVSRKELPFYIIELETKMKLAADNLDFEAAIDYREKIDELKKEMIG